MTPLLRATLAFACGLVPGLLAPPPLLWPAFAVAGLALGWLASGRGSGPACLAAFLALGLAAGTGAGARARAACALHWRDGQVLVVRGHLSAAPVTGRSVGFQPTGRTCAEELRVTLPPRAPPPSPGEPVWLRGTWQPYGVGGGWPLPAVRAGLLRGTSVQVDTAGEAAAVVRVRAAAQLAFRSALPRRHAVAEALVLARNEALDPALRNTFAAAGLSHLLAISGAHVVIIAAVLLLLLRLLHLPHRIARVAGLLLVAVYVAAVGAPPAAARAALQFALIMGALLLQRPAHAWTVMAAAALLLLVVDPLNALDAGFQLSFAGVAGLLAYRRRLIEALPARVPAPLRDGIASGVAATVATFPIAALHFGQFAPIGLPATIIASPIIALALPGLACVLAAHAFAPAVLPWIAPGVELLLGAFLAIARAAAAVPYGHFRVSSSSLAGLLIAAAAILLWEARRRSRHAAPPPASPAAERRLRRRRRLQLLEAAAAATMALAWAPRLAPDTGHVEVHVIDVGQGDAIAIRTPHGRWLLVDAGDRNERTDQGARRVVPYLLRRGVRKLDMLLLTHPHADHIGGALSVLDAFAVGTVLDPGAPGPTVQYLETLRAAALEPARWIVPRAGDALALDGVQLRFLYPAERSLDAPDDANDLSLVFRVGFGDFGALMLGDAPRSVEASLVDRYGGTLAAAVLKVGHHGSSTSTSTALIQAVAPRVAMISVGRKNRYGHPSPDVVARLLRHHARVLRTDEHGSLVVSGWRSGRIRVGTER